MTDEQPDEQPAEPGDPGYRERVMQALGVPLGQFEVRATGEGGVVLVCGNCGLPVLESISEPTLNELVAAAVDHRSGPAACTP